MRDDDRFTSAMIIVCEVLLFLIVMVGVTIASVMQWWQ